MKLNVNLLGSFFLKSFYDFLFFQVDLTDFCRQNIIPELQKPNVDEMPVLKAAAVKYIMTFRSQMPTDVIKGCLPLIIKHLKVCFLRETNV